MHAQPPSLTLAAASQHSLTICFFADTRKSPSSMSRRAQSTSRSAAWVLPRRRCVGLSPISPKSSWSRVRTTSGMIAPYSIFLRIREQRIAYVRQVARSVKPGGHIIVSTFGPEGPTKCSGLEVMRYDAESLHSEFGASFRPIESSKEVHHTPFGTTQQFLYCYCRID